MTMCDVFVPYTAVERDTVDALAAAGAVPVFVDVSGDDEAYWRFLSDRWQAGRDFVVIEQDIVVGPYTLERFEVCESAWCAAVYPYLGSQTYAGLGCTRFRASLIGAEPDLMEFVGTLVFDGHTPRHWCVNDAAMQTELWSRGYHVCVHEQVGHLSDGPTHGCCG